MFTHVLCVGVCVCVYFFFFLFLNQPGAQQKAICTHSNGVTKKSLKKELFAEVWAWFREAQKRQWSTLEVARAQANTTPRPEGAKRGWGCQNLARLMAVGEGCRMELWSSVEKWNQFWARNGGSQRNKYQNLTLLLPPILLLSPPITHTKVEAAGQRGRYCSHKGHLSPKAQWEGYRVFYIYIYYIYIYIVYI